MKSMIRCAAAGAVALGLIAGCGGVTTSHTQFRAPGPSQATDMTVSPSRAALLAPDADHPAQTQAFAAVATDGYGRVVDGAAFTWTVFDTRVATVDGNGVVTPVGLGTTNLTATLKDNPAVTARAQIIVGSGQLQLSFDRDIKPLTGVCAACHPAQFPEGGSMADLANITGKGFVKASDPPEGSTYLTTPRDGKLPNGSDHPGGKAWSSTNAKTVSDWIQQGAKP